MPIDPRAGTGLRQKARRKVCASHCSERLGRLIAAANQDLEREVEAKRFRQDLFYRLDVVRIAVPPLRARGADILLWALHFLQRFAGDSRGAASLSEGAAAKLLTYNWPGNVRELEHCIARAVALSRSSELTIADLPEKIQRFELADVAPPAHAPEAPEPARPGRN